MNTIINALRQIVGNADFYVENGSYSGSWDYGAMIEYMSAVLILCIVISSIFRFITRWIGK